MREGLGAFQEFGNLTGSDAGGGCQGSLFSIERTFDDGFECYRDVAHVSILATN